MKSNDTFFFICIFILLTSTIFPQKYGYNEEIQVNQESFGIQTNSQVISLDEKKFMICWKSDGDSDESSGIFGQVFDENGNKLAKEQKISNAIDYYQPRIIKLDRDRIIVFGQARRGNGNKEAIFCSIFHMNTNIIGKELQVTNFMRSFDWQTKYLKLNRNKVVACWTDLERDGWNGGIFAQIIDFSENNIGTSFQVNTYTDDFQERPSIERLSDSSFIISWDSYKQDGSFHGVYFQILDEFGNKIGKESIVNTFTESIQWESKILRLNESRFVICWESSTQDGSGKGIYAQIFDFNASKIGNEFRVNTYTDNSQKNIQLNLLRNGDFIVLWNSDKVDGSGYGVSAQIFDVNGIRKSNELLINSSNEGWQTLSNCVVVDDDKFIVNYISQSMKNHCYSVMMQVLLNNGEKLGKEIVLDNYSSNISYFKVENITVGALEFDENKFIVNWNSPTFNTEILGKVYLTHPINHNFKNYLLNEPSNDKTLETAKPNFAWQYPSDQHINFQWEIEYDLYISEDELFTNPRVIKGITDTTYQIDTLAAGKSYFWKVLAKNFYGDSLWSSNVNGFFIDHGATDVDKSDPSADGLPKEFVLEQNYPNPFNPTTKIKYTIPAVVEDENFSSLKNVKLEVFNTLGQKIKTLVNKSQQAGTYEVEFQANNLPSGVYYYRIQYGKISETKKMLLLR